MTALRTRHASRPPRKSVQITSALLLFCLAAPIYATAPGIRVLATGGTIAGVSDPTGATSYVAGKLSAEQLTAQLPQLAKIARLSTEQVMNVPSQDMRDEDRVLLAQRVRATLDDPAVDGIVITHGTDTLEETAGNMSRAARDSVAAAVRAGVFVVRASRLPAAHVSRKGEIDDDALGTVVSGDLSPQKARLVCQLALRQPQTAKSLQQLIFKVAGEPST